MKIYISGPMTGHPDYNFRSFFDAEELILKLGHTALNPAWQDGYTFEEAKKSAKIKGHSWGQYMREDLKMLMMAEGIVLLDGWRESKGAKLEAIVAGALDMQFYKIKNNELINYKYE
jgi:hypothetical protein